MRGKGERRVRRYPFPRITKFLFIGERQRRARLFLSPNPYLFPGSFYFPEGDSPVKWTIVLQWLKLIAKRRTFPRIRSAGAGQIPAPAPLPFAEEQLLSFVDRSDSSDSSDSSDLPRSFSPAPLPFAE